MKKVLIIAVLIVLVLAIIMMTQCGRSNEDSKAETDTKEKYEETLKNESEEKEQTNEEEKSKTKKEISLPEGLQNHLASDFLKILMSEEYMIKYETATVYENQPFAVETIYAVSDKDIAILSAERAAIIKDGIVYMVNHKDKHIIRYAATGTDNPKRIDIEGIAFIGKYESNGYVCEEYASTSTNLKMYFDGEKLVKIIINTNKQEQVMNIVEVNEEVPVSLFDVPMGYTTDNL